MNDSIVMLIVLLFIGAICAFCYFAAILIDFSYKRREKILQKKYPAFYVKRKAMNLASVNSLYKEINAMKNKIDQLMEELPYYPIEQLSEKQMQVEILKKEYQQIKAKDKINDLKVDRYYKEMIDIYKATPDLQKFYKWEVRD